MEIIGIVLLGVFVGIPLICADVLIVCLTIMGVKNLWEDIRS